MNFKEVTYILRMERRRMLALSRMCDPALADSYLRTARALLIAAETVEREGQRHRRKEKKT